MSISQHIAAYDDCFKVFERALRKATRVCLASNGEARNFIMRMHQARSLQREETKRLYPHDDVRWGKSMYDKLKVRGPFVDDAGEWWVYVQSHEATILAIEDLEDTDAARNLD